MKKVIILRKMYVTIKSFTPPFSTIERNYHVSAADLLHIVLEQDISLGTNAGIAKTK